MDEAVALVVAAPVIALSLWALAFVGGFANGQARSAVAAELAAQAAARVEGAQAADAAEQVAVGATLSACSRTRAALAHTDAGQSAAVTVVCEVSGPLSGSRVCFAGYAQDRPAVSTHVRIACEPWWRAG